MLLLIEEDKKKKPIYVLGDLSFDNDEFKEKGELDLDVRLARMCIKLFVGYLTMKNPEKMDPGGYEDQPIPKVEKGLSRLMRLFAIRRTKQYLSQYS